jgi:hypothetical protein
MVIQRRSADGPLGADPMCTFDAIRAAWPVLAESASPGAMGGHPFLSPPKRRPPSGLAPYGDSGFLGLGASCRRGCSPRPLPLRQPRTPYGGSYRPLSFMISEAHSRTASLRSAVAGNWTWRRSISWSLRPSTERCPASSATWTGGICNPCSGVGPSPPSLMDVADLADPPTRDGGGATVGRTPACRVTEPSRIHGSAC